MIAENKQACYTKTNGVIFVATKTTKSQTLTDLQFPATLKMKMMRS